MNTPSDDHAPHPPVPWPIFEATVAQWRQEQRGCPGDDALVTYWEGLQPWWPRLKAWWHIHRCALCQTDLATLHEAFAERPHALPEETWLVQGWQALRFRWRYALPLAMVMVVGTVFLFRHMQPEEPTWRGGGAPQIIRASHPAVRLAEILAACQAAGYVCIRLDGAGQVVDIRTPEFPDARFTQFLDHFGIHPTPESTIRVEIKSEATP